MTVVVYSLCFLDLEFFIRSTFYIGRMVYFRVMCVLDAPLHIPVETAYQS